MYDKIKVLFNHPTYRNIVIGGIGLVIILCIGYIFYQSNGSDYQRTINAVERAQKQQRESVELNRSVQRSIDRSTDYSREAATRIERSTQYNRQINDRIGQSQSGLSEARSYLERNAELFDRIERESRKRREDYQTSQDATQPITDIRSGCDNRNCDTRIAR